jgi:hypothetical protein
MRFINGPILVASLLFVPAPVLFAQSTVDPSGHWTGAIHIPAYNGASAREVGIDVDIAKTAGGGLEATFGQPAQNIKGLPLGKVSLDGPSISFELKAKGGGLFKGIVADAKKISGEFITTEGGFAIPFDLTRTGDAQIQAAPRSAAIGKELEGTWNGTIAVDGKKERLVLKMANQQDGTATGTIQDLDGSNVEIPVAMTQQGARLTIEVAAVNAAFTAVLTGSELAGTWAQGGLALPLTFTRGAK